MVLEKKQLPNRESQMKKIEVIFWIAWFLCWTIFYTLFMYFVLPQPITGKYKYIVLGFAMLMTLILTAATLFKEYLKKKEAAHGRTRNLR